jgi:alpha-D-ribose 1-methylphosphonate 5-triphosphate synthase subunit PhnI
MPYVAARGGESAILQAERLYHALKTAPTRELIRAIEQTMPYLIDRLIGEGSLYAPELAALALAQTGGDLYEAVLLLRAYRSTQPRIGYALPLDPAKMITVRRISAAFKDIPGGQVLGPTLDYSHRLLRMDLLTGANDESLPPVDPAERPAAATYPLVADWQRANGLIATEKAEQNGQHGQNGQDSPVDPAEIPDVTRDPIAIPAPRAHRLQSLARADTGGVLALGYSSMRGYGFIHPTVNELRLAHAEVEVTHPVTGAVFSAGRVRVSQAEVVSQRAADGKIGYKIGFCATLGWNEVKTIAGATLDLEMNSPDAHPALSEDFVLYHTEPVESSGFCIHFKLPHYVTFASDTDSLRKAMETLYGIPLEMAGLKAEAAEPAAPTKPQAQQTQGAE